jgi:polysaccharide pyruvyl transferase WcaK-like protein
LANNKKVHQLLPTYLEHPIVTGNRLRFFGTPDRLFGSLKTFDFAIGTRIHGNVAPLLMGVPSMTIAIDSRVEGIAKYFNMPYIWYDEITENTSVEELYYRALVELPDFYSTYKEKYEEYMKFLTKNEVQKEDINPRYFI